MPLFLKRHLINFVFLDTMTHDSRRKFMPFIRRAERILDIGALRSPLTDTTDPTCQRIFALDVPWGDHFGFSANIIGALKKRRNIRLLFGTGEILPFRANSIDLVIITEVLEHIPSDGAAVAEIKRVLKPGGIVLLTVPHLEAIPLEAGIKEHLRHYTKAMIMDLFAKDYEILRFEERFRGREETRYISYQDRYSRSNPLFFLVAGLDLLIKLYFLHLHIPVRNILLPYSSPGTNLLLIGRKK